MSTQIKQRRGRPKGARNKKTAEDTRRAEASGIMPKFVLLKEMRYHHARAQALLKQRPSTEEEEEHRHRRVAEAFEAARLAAQAAAPYFHAKLTTTRGLGDDDASSAIRNLRLEDLSDQQLDVLIRHVELSLDVGGEGLGR